MILMAIDIVELVFIYSCPDGSGNTKSAPVKLRMLYSTSKANAENVATSTGLEVALKVPIHKMKLSHIILLFSSDLCSFSHFRVLCECE